MFMPYNATFNIMYYNYNSRLPKLMLQFITKLQYFLILHYFNYLLTITLKSYSTNIALNNEKEVIQLENLIRCYPILIFLLRDSAYR